MKTVQTHQSYFQRYAVKVQNGFITSKEGQNRYINTKDVNVVLTYTGLYSLNSPNAGMKNIERYCTFMSNNQKQHCGATFQKYSCTMMETASM